ncbi:MAG TPA: PKD domain-containing protein, partial [Pirellulales bacterium]|nr:PKD domain-containing protein [Pirellulales bacterium]
AATASGGDGGPLSYSWDINGDGTFGDAVGSNPTLTWSQLEALSPPINDGPATFQVSVRVSDAHSEYVVSAPVSLTVNDAAPTATLTNDGPIKEGGSTTVSFTSPLDPSSADTAAGFHYSLALDPGSLATSYAAAGTATSASFTFPEDGSYTVDGRIFDKDNGYTDYQTVVTVNEVAPTATLSNNGPVDEASPATVSFTNPFSPSQADTNAGFHYSFALSAAGLATSYLGAGTNSTMQYTFDNSGTYTVYGRIFDQDNASTDYQTSVTVNEARPTITVSGSTISVRGQSQTFTFSASDPAPVSQPPTFTYLVYWGDGSPSQTFSGAGATIQVPHVYAASGSFTIKVSATDEDGSKSTNGILQMTVSGAALEGNNLFVGGTTAADTIVVAPSDLKGDLNVTMNGATTGPYHPTGQLIVYGQAGDDNIQLQSASLSGKTAYVAIPAVLFGTAGNNTLDARGSSANDVLVGGPGNDTLYGGKGRNLLIGGAGSDMLYAGGAGDILIAGTTAYDTDLTALDAIMAEWGRTDISYQQRIDDLLGTSSGGLNGSYLLNTSTVHDDGAVDHLYGGSGQDWYFYHSSGAYADVLKNKKGSEIATVI